MRLSYIVGLLLFILVTFASGKRRRRRRRRDLPTPPPPRDCVLSSWSSWSSCSHRCGNTGIRSRTRSKLESECCGGKCWSLTETASCNRNNCRNGGTPTTGRCICSGGYTGTCCERDICSMKPCQHTCINRGSRYECVCNACYTKVGSRACELKKCKIGGKCYSYGARNPGNSCQECRDDNQRRWTNSNNGRSCDDGDLCTKQDSCRNGRCVGTPYTCRSSYPQSSCVETSVCVGNGMCRNVLKQTSTVCRPAVDACDMPERCDGRIEMCPAKEIAAIEIRLGAANLTDSNFTKVAMFQSNTAELFLKLSNFSANCGNITFTWALLNSSDQCSVNATAKMLPSDADKHVLAGLTLRNTQAYKVAVLATDFRGKPSSAVCTKPLTIDTREPSTGYVNDGIRHDVDYQSETTVYRGNWDGFHDGESGIAEYRYMLKDQHGVVVKNWTSSGLEKNISVTNLALVDGNTYRLVVRAIDRARNHIDAQSDGVTIDATPPKIAGVLIAAKRVRRGNKTVVYVSLTNRIIAAWPRLHDTHSGILKYQWAVVRANVTTPTDWKKVTGYKLRTLAVLGPLSLARGVEYRLFIRGINNAGLHTDFKSPVFMYYPLH